MNDLERDHILITRNSDLLHNTRITPTLLSKIRIHLSEYEKQELDNIRELRNKIDQADAFYALVVTKPGLYNQLIDAFTSEAQHAPANWLRELPEEYRQQPQLSNTGQANSLPNPQQYGNQPNLSHQNQEIVHVPTPISHGPPNPSQTSQASSGDMAELMKKLELSESEVRKLLDFVKDVTPLDVDVLTPTQSLDYQEHSYNLPPESKGLKGYALFLNIIKFENGLRSREEGADIDMRYMSELWSQLGYKIFPKSIEKREKDLKFKEDIKRMISDFKEACHKGKPRSIIVFIGSHGGWNTICTSDPKDDKGNLVTIKLYEEIVDEFSTEKLKDQPKNQPKIFLIQTCQDHIPVRNATDDVPPDFHISDTIVCTAQVPGAVSHRDKYKGSWFLYCLTYVFMKKAHKLYTLREMLDIVRIIINSRADNFVPGNCVRSMYKLIVDG
ncbi:unnamed protein product [Orchesella dallaii]|uniref:Uncharacterized protein n=1 Tax=Orchesella dallaii TaxID=48710 RepID=A0ABP1RCZ0_9HEXA